MSVETRILILALRGRDADVMQTLLGKQGVDCLICAGLDEVAQELVLGAGAVIVTEESLGSVHSPLIAWLEAQPAWSDFPFILLATKRVGRRPLAAQQLLERMGNVVVLERPIHGETLASAVKSALRGRGRQYETRRLLSELTSAEGRLTQANAGLEEGIAQRTTELSNANNRLTEEILERERAQAALAQSQKMEAVGQLTGGIAHDFNNLLTAIYGNLELILGRTEEPRTAKLAGYAREAAERAAKLTHQLLAFSRSQRLDLQPTDLNALVLGMSDLLVRTIGHQLVIDMKPASAAPWAKADKNQLELAILNLAINARDAMGEHGRLEIATRLDVSDDPALGAARYAVVSVEDTGTGIPPALLSKVFDPFFTTKPVGKGTGLGLSQVFGIAQQSSGTVTVDSVEGRGTRIEIWLPAAEAQDERALTTDPERSMIVGGRPKVLVIDDDEGVRRYVVEGLQGLGYDVAAAAGGADGLSQLETRPPDLLIVDYAMPGMNGVEVIREVRRRRPGLPVVLATGFADMAAVESVLTPDRILRKPFRLAELETAARAALTAVDPVRETTP